MRLISDDSPLSLKMHSASLRQLGRGQVMDEDEARSSIHLIKSGFIKRYSITHDGAESIQVIYGPGDIFPLTPVFKVLFDLDIYHGPETYYYEAITDTKYYSLSLLSLSEAVGDEPNIYSDLLRVAGARLNSNIQQLENMSLRTTSKRIAHLLAYYAEKFGRKTPRGTAILVPLTHQSIADSLNMARETVSRQLTLLEDREIIALEKPIVVKDIEQLKNEYITS